MHIGLIIYGHLDIISGGYLYDKQLVTYLREQGHTVTIFSLPWRSYWRHLGDNFWRKWQQQVLTADLDVLIQDELNHPSLLRLNQVLQRKRPFPVIALIHLLRSTEPHPRWLLPFYRQIECTYLRQVDGFIHNSQDTAQAVQAMGVSGKPSIVAYPGGDHWSSDLTASQISARANEAGPIRILYVGNYIARKGLHVLLAALAGLDKEMWQLTAVGRPDLEPHYVKQLDRVIEQNQLYDQVKLMGERPFTAMPTIFRNHQLFIMPSLYEPFGIVYLEALGSGLPVIATTAGAGHELIQSGTNGYLVAPEDPSAIRQHIQNLHQDRHLLTQMSLAACRRYEQHPTWADTGKKIETFLQETITASQLGTKFL